VRPIAAKCRRCQEQGNLIPAWVRVEMDERFRRVEEIEQRIQMLLLTALRLALVAARTAQLAHRTCHASGVGELSAAELSAARW